MNVINRVRHILARVNETLVLHEDQDVSTTRIARAEGFFYTCYFFFLSRMRHSEASRSSIRFCQVTSYVMLTFMTRKLVTVTTQDGTSEELIRIIPSKYFCYWN